MTDDRDGDREDKELQIRMLRKRRYELLDEIHKKQQSIDAIDLAVSRLRGEL